MAQSTFPVTPGTVAVPLLALVALTIDIPPFFWHIRNRNLAASSLVFWVFLSNLMNFINALVWPTDDVQNWWDGLVLCDIEVKLMIGATVGVVGSLACIMRNLARVLDTDRTVMSPSKAQRRRHTAIQLLFCFGGSLYLMLVHYVVQPNRYYIFAISGCTSSFDNSWPKLVLVLIWPPILCLVVVYYSILVIARMRRYRKNFSEVLLSSNSNMTKSRFMRLFLLAITLIVIVLPTQIYVLYQNSVVPLVPYSWALVHGPAWWNISLIPTGGMVLFDRWIQIAGGFVVFIFFGLGQEAKTMYRKWLLKIGFDRIFPCLIRQHPRNPATISQADSFGSRARLFFNRRGPQNSILSLHSYRKSTSVSPQALSPAEPQKGFGSLSAISENESKDQITPSASTVYINKTPIPQEPTRNRESWLTSFPVGTHLSAPMGRLGATTSNPTLLHDSMHFFNK